MCLFSKSLFLCVVRRTIRINHEYIHRSRHFFFNFTSFSAYVCSFDLFGVCVCLCIGALKQQQSSKRFFLHLVLCHCCLDSATRLFQIFNGSLILFNGTFLDFWPESFQSFGIKRFIPVFFLKIRKSFASSCLLDSMSDSISEFGE